MPTKSDGHGTDEEEDEEDYVDEPEDGSFRLMNALKVPRATTYTAQALFDQMYNDDIDLDPEYQRGEVWSKDKQTRLIDSVLRNFYIPPIIFAVSTSPDGSERKTCIDGKQRLTSIRKFMDGVIPHVDPETSKKYWYRAPESVSSYKLLPEQYRRLFTNKQVVCVEYSDLSGEDERDIFRRVQMGMALTPAEKLGANDTPRSRWIKELCHGELVTDLPFSKLRGTDFRVIAGAVMLCMNWPGVTDASQSPEKWVQVAESVPKQFKKDLEASLTALSQLKLKTDGSTLKRLSPLEMVGMIVFIHIRRMDGKESSQLQQEANALHTALHKELKAIVPDLRLNGRCGQWTINWIKGRESRKSKRQRDDADYNPQMLPTPKR